LAHDPIEELDPVHSSRRAPVEVEVIEKRENVPASAEERSTNNRLEQRVTPSLERKIDAFGIFGCGVAAENTSTGKLIDGIDHLPEELALPTPA
jgi:hypothetical protein